VWGVILSLGMMHFQLVSVCVLVHISHIHHTTCIELNFLEDNWGIIWWMIVMTWAVRCLRWDRLVHLEMEYGGMSSLV